MIQQYEGRAVLDTDAYYNHGMYGAGLQHGDAVIRRPLVGAVQEDTDGPDHLGQNSKKPSSLGHLPPPPPPPGPFTPTSDARSNFESSPLRSRSEGPWAAYDNIDPRETESLDLVDADTGEISRHRYLLCPADIIGFVLKPRRWGQYIHWKFDNANSVATSDYKYTFKELMAGSQTF